MSSKEVLQTVVCQMTSVDDLATNSRQVLKLLEDALASGPVDLVCFPEASLYLKINMDEPPYGLTLTDPAFRELTEWCQKHKVLVNLGSVPLQMNDGKIYNSTILIDETGLVSAPYQKMHLFDVDLAGQKPIRESDGVTHGKSPALDQRWGWTFGLSICYDLRFPELFLRYARQHADVLLLPSAFAVKTGKDHWEILLRARAIECQAYVIAAAQDGEHRSRLGLTRQSYGHSMIIDPWGLVLAEAPAGPGIIRAALQRDRISQVRSQIPVEHHRRLE